MILAIDPGKHICGCAVFYPCGALAQVASTPTSEMDKFIASLLVAHDSLTIVCERPKRRLNCRATFRDVDNLTAFADGLRSWRRAGGRGTLPSRAGGRVAAVRLVAPEDWKGQVPKIVHQARIIDKLEPGEVRIVRPWMESDRNWKDICDAVGIGLWFVGRLEGTREP